LGVAAATPYHSVNGRAALPRRPNISLLGPNWSASKNNVAVMNGDFWVLARLRRWSMPAAACD
jgi:hypothetical protein